MRANAQGPELPNGLQVRAKFGGGVSREGGCHWLEAHEVMLTDVTYLLMVPLCLIPWSSVLCQDTWNMKNICISYVRDFIRYTW